MINGDTIAAIATGMSNAGISIIRISGTQAEDIADRIFKTKSKKSIIKNMESHTVKYGFIYDNDIIIDEVLVTLMKAPKSYTAEDVVEINCHGGITVTKQVLDLVIRAGARPAEPGEFTKRAFLNGRIDLSQAEAVIDIINSKNSLALKNSVNQLRGNIQTRIKDIRENILLDVAFIEAALDDPEHISLDGFKEKLEHNTKQNICAVEKLIQSSDNGRIIKEGIKTVILGKPNAGKSSLLNLLAKDDRAIVTEIAGTTRDTLEETININGITLNLIDTAGIRETEDIVERIGVKKAIDISSDADLIIYVADSSVPLDENDLSIIDMIKDRNAVVLLNKSDLEAVTDEAVIKEKTGKKVIKISAKENTGIDDLENEITNMFFAGGLDFNDEVYITNARHKAALQNTLSSLGQVMESIENDMPEDFYSIDLMNAYEELGKITGEAVDEDLVNTIFREFCMGK